MTNDTNRREFLNRAAAFGVFGGAAPLAMQLAAAGNAAAAEATGYKALVCLFLMGGQDSNNMIMATDTDSWSRYQSARGGGVEPIALKHPTDTRPLQARDGRGQALTPLHWPASIPFSPATPQPTPGGGGAARTFAMHPLMGPLMPLWNGNPATNDAPRLAIMANVGMLLRPTTKSDYFNPLFKLPPALGSHNDQQSAWLSAGIDGTRFGWGGLMSDLFRGNQDSTFASISAAGNTVFLAGQDVNQYHVNSSVTDPAVVINTTTGNNQLFGSTAARNIYSELLTSAPGANATTSNFTKDYVAAVNRSVAAANTLNTAVRAGPVIPDSPFYDYVYTDPSSPNRSASPNPWVEQLRIVARMIAVAPSMGLKRQVFFLCVDAHDTHDAQNSREGTNLGRLAHAMAYFDAQMKALGMLDKVTTFTAGDFSRGFTTNGNGTDHAWGGHHFIMGGAVKGGDIYGAFPQLGIDRAGYDNPNFAGNIIIPTTSVDQYASAMGRWFGLSTQELRSIFPNLQNFPGGGADANLPPFMRMT